MALIVLELPPAVKIVSRDWRLAGGVARMRSEFTGRPWNVRLGPAARWSCRFRLAPAVGVPDDVFRVQAQSLLAAGSRPDVAFLVFMQDRDQTSLVSVAQVDGPGQSGFQLALRGLPNSSAILPPGGRIGIQYPPGHEQVVTLLETLTSNGTGRATAVFDQPLRQSPADGNFVRISRTAVAMQFADTVAWTDLPGDITQWPEIDAVEAY